uniref:Protein SWAP n=1 Tax=Ascaris suum TaxID=6253 RepID=F1KV68_ASCSU
MCYIFVREVRAFDKYGLLRSERCGRSVAIRVKRIPNKRYDKSYDCRLYLNSLEEFDVNESSEMSFLGAMIDEYTCPSEALEEEMCEEERYKDLYDDIRRVEEEENEKQRRAEIGFSYDDESVTKEESSSSEEEIEEPFRPPEGIKLPVGMNLPETMKQNAVIERTATFVVAQGVQMEIVIKAKQRGNLDQFGFLEFDHPLNAYYKYISKMIREKKYVPKPHIPQRRPKPKKLRRLQEEEERRRLATTAETEKDARDNSSESDSDGEHYLHPLLMGGGAAIKEPSRGSSPLIGPKTKEDIESTSTPPPQVKVDYEIGKGNDMYSSLFNSLAGIVHSQSTPAILKRSTNDTEGEETMVEDDDYVQWYVSFYGKRPPTAQQPTIVPPPPNMAKAVNSAAEYVAKCGCQGEYLLAERADVAWDFVKPSSAYYPYYQSRVRFYQLCNAEAAQKTAAEEGEPSTSAEVKLENGNEEVPCKRQETLGVNDDSISRLATDGSPELVKKFEEEDIVKEVGDERAGDGDESTAMEEDGAQVSAVQPPVYMNRKMRRRGFHDLPSRVQQATQQNEQTESTDRDSEVPLLSAKAAVSPKLPKVQSSPALLVHSTATTSTANEAKKTVGPISFSLVVPKADEQRTPRTSAAILGAYDDDEDNMESAAKGLDVPAGVVTNIPPPGLAIPPPPLAPIPLASGQLALEGSAELQMERKHRARLFMEKILNEKRAAKLRAQNEEQQKKDEGMKRKEMLEEQSRKETIERRAITLAGSSKKASSMKKVDEKSRDAIDLTLSPHDIDKLISTEIEKLVTETPMRSSAEKSISEKVDESTTKERKKKKKKKKKRRESEEEDGEIPSSDDTPKKRRHRHRSRSTSSEVRHRKSKKKRRHRSSSEDDRSRRKHRSVSRKRQK